MSTGKFLHEGHTRTTWAYIGSIMCLEGKYNGVGCLVPDRIDLDWPELCVVDEMREIRMRTRERVRARVLREVLNAERRGDLDEAERLANAFRATHGRSAEVSALLDRLRHLREEKQKKAEEERRRAFETRCQDAETLEKGGGDRDLSRALASWREALKFAVTEADRKKVRERIASLQKRLQERGVDRRRLQTLEKAKRALQWGNLSEAERIYRAVLREFPGDADARAGLRKIESQRTEKTFKELMERGRRAEARGDWRTAIQYYEKALAAKRGSREARAAIDRLKGKREYEAAIQAAKQAEGRGEWQRAKEEYERALSHRSGDETATAGVARMERALRGITPAFDKVFLVPKEEKDQHGNPVVTRKGLKIDPNSGWPYEIWLHGPRIEFVRIPAGEFAMGSPESEEDHNSKEEPVHRVKIPKAFYMGKYECTQAQWVAVTRGNPSRFRGNNLPVEQVNWLDVKNFLEIFNKALKKVTGTEQFKVRLPTEAEWEYVCRAGTRTRYNTGDKEEDLAAAGWYDENSGRRTHFVGKKKANKGGLYDMHGNVWEWCEDAWHGDYEGAPRNGEAWPGRGIHRVVRGGSWYNSEGRARSAYRLAAVAATRKGHVGFRIVLEIK
ncbi:MAG: SUMF1/EgtB/PvdO family nonheme iron enzyme [Planctomycetota bacterium]|jgi:formylglycine-generating enzyme required for sulfatase activity